MLSVRDTLNLKTQAGKRRRGQAPHPNNSQTHWHVYTDTGQNTSLIKAIHCKTNTTGEVTDYTSVLNRGALQKEQTLTGLKGELDNLITVQSCAVTAGRWHTECVCKPVGCANIRVYSYT